VSKIGWVLGWAVPEAWFAPLARGAFPTAAHTFVPAASDALAWLEAAGPFDWVVGYSLGAQRLLGEASRAEKMGRVALLAPSFAFSSEAGLGGKVAVAQVRFLVRWLRRDPTAALADFYARAGLNVPPELVAGLSLEILQWGLDQLETVALPPALPAGWRAWCGADDALLDAARLHALAPEITVVPGATHHPGGLLQAFAEEVP
jgi:hypothetical protein